MGLGSAAPPGAFPEDEEEEEQLQFQDEEEEEGEKAAPDTESPNTSNSPPAASPLLKPPADQHQRIPSHVSQYHHHHHMRHRSASSVSSLASYASAPEADRALVSPTRSEGDDVTNGNGSPLNFTDIGLDDTNEGTDEEEGQQLEQECGQISEQGSMLFRTQASLPRSVSASAESSMDSEPRPLSSIPLSQSMDSISAASKSPAGEAEDSTVDEVVGTALSETGTDEPPADAVASRVEYVENEEPDHEDDSRKDFNEKRALPPLLPPDIPSISTPSPDSASARAAKPPAISVRTPRAPGAVQNIDLPSFRRWITGLVAVGFDLEAGQSVERVWPDDLISHGPRLSEAEKKIVSFASFPDSNSASHLGDSVFSFRVKRHAGQLPLSSPVSRLPSGLISPMAGSAGSVLSPILPQGLHMGEERASDDGDGCLFGYVYFRQARDEGIKRGFFQKSLVILSPHPFPGLFCRLVRLIGRKYLDMLQEGTRRGMPGPELQDRLDVALCKVAAEIAHWPSPPATDSLTALQAVLNPLPPRSAGSLSRDGSNGPLPLHNHSQSACTTLDLPLLSLDLSLSFPSQSCAQYYPPHPGKDDPARPCRLHDLFHAHLDSLWALWELVVLGEPILVQGDTPRACGEAVWCLVEMVAPLEYGLSWRPYFTVQDPEFRTVRGGKAWSGGILGVTNPVFGKALGEAWSKNVVGVRRIAVQPARAVTVAATEDGLAAAMAGQPLARGAGHLISTSPRGRREEEGKARKIQGEAVKVAAKAAGEAQSTTGRLAAFFKMGRGKSPSRSVTSTASSSSSATAESAAKHQAHTEVVQSVVTKHKPILSKDKTVIRKVAEAAIRGQPAHILNNILRRHFAELTSSFLSPLDLYFDTLLDEGTRRLGPALPRSGKQLAQDLAFLLEPPDVQSFRVDSFLTYVSAHPPTLPVAHSKPLIGLYQAFLKSPNFGKWLRNKYRAAYGDWRHRYLTALCEFDVSEYCSSRDEVEVVEVLLRLREELERCRVKFAHDVFLEPSSPVPSFPRARPFPRHVVEDEELVLWSDMVLPTREQYHMVHAQAGKVIELLPENLRGGFGWFRRLTPAASAGAVPVPSVVAAT